MQGKYAQAAKLHNWHCCKPSHGYIVYGMHLLLLLLPVAICVHMYKGTEGGMVHKAINRQMLHAKCNINCKRSIAIVAFSKHERRTKLPERDCCRLQLGAQGICFVLFMQCTVSELARSQILPFFIRLLVWPKTESSCKSRLLFPACA